MGTMCEILSVVQEEAEKFSSSGNSRERKARRGLVMSLVLDAVRNAFPDIGDRFDVCAIRPGDTGYHANALSAFFLTYCGTGIIWAGAESYFAPAPYRADYVREGAGLDICWDRLLPEEAAGILRQYMKKKTVCAYEERAEQLECEAEKVRTILREKSVPDEIGKDSLCDKKELPVSAQRVFYADYMPGSEEQGGCVLPACHSRKVIGL